MASNSERSCDLVVVGAGAAGLWAAAVAARGGASVLLLEKTPRTGTKVLASGGTRCNLTTTLGPGPAAELFGREGARFLAPAFRALSPADVRDRFEALGVATVKEELEKVFPKSGSAREVRDALERDARVAGVVVRLDAAVAGLTPIASGGSRGAGGWEIVLADGDRVRARRAIVCPGGKSYPRTGTTGDGYGWLAELGLPIVEPVPALVPLSSPAPWVRDLAGISVQDAEARLEGPGANAALGLVRRRRPVLFTHRGVSGPGAMDLSHAVARAAGQAHRLRLDLLPELSREALRDLLVEAAGRPGAPALSRVLPAALARRLVEAVAAQAGLGAVDPKPNGLDREARHRLVEALKGLEIPIDGTLGWDQAEVTAGGLALTHVDPGTMRVRGFEGLYACGEILDLQGPIGGLSFQAAFATAELAGRDAGRP